MRKHTTRANRKPVNGAKAWDESDEETRQPRTPVRKVAKPKPIKLRQPVSPAIQWPKWPEWLIDQTMREKRAGRVSAAKDAEHAKNEPEVAHEEERWQNYLKGRGYICD